jgi:biopolymer transport protein ExbB
MVIPCLFLALLLFVGVAWAQDGGGEEGGRTVTWLDTILAGGVVGAMIIVLSIVSLALVIEHFVTIRRDRLMPPEIREEIEVLFEDGEFEEAMELCEAEPNYFTNVVGGGLPKLHRGYDKMMEGIAKSADEESIRLHQKIGYLSLIGNIAPMMGLLGTVQGMISAFQKIAITAGAAEPRQLADGISLALVTTFLGLIVAIPTMISFFYFRSRVVRIGLEIQNTAEELFDRFDTDDS